MSARVARVPASEVERFDPAAHDFYWSDDGAEVTVVRLLWVDDASYATWQASDAERDWTNLTASAGVEKEASR